MKLQNAKARFVTCVLFALTALTCAAVSTMKRTLIVNSDPQGAAVFLDDVYAGPTPFDTNRIRDDIPLHVQVVMKDYAPEETNYSFKLMNIYTKDRRTPWTLPTFSLVRLHTEVPIRVNSSVDGASVYTNNHLAGFAPWAGTLVFDRAKSDPWGAFTIGIVRSNYHVVITNITEPLAEAKESTGIEVNATMVEIRRDIQVEIKAGTQKEGVTRFMNDANVFLDDMPAGATTLKTNVTFTRADGTHPWSTVTVRISKEGYEYRPPGQDATPEFVKTLTVDSAAAGSISAEDFEPVKFVSVLLRSFEITEDKLKVQYSNVMAEVSQSEPNGQTPTPFTTAKPEDALVASRISVWPDRTDKIVYSKLIRDPRSGTGMHEVVIGAHICVNDSGLETPMGEERRYYDVDPFVTSDGKYIYFSSDRGGTRNIWRMEADGTLPQPITVNTTSVDTEPVISADGATLAYTSRPIGALPSTPSTIWIATDALGTLAAPTKPGHSPAWSPDGKKIAFVSPDNKIWLMDRRGKLLAQLTDGDWNDGHPIWTPTGNRIIFASDRALNDRKEHNWDIWIMRSDGSEKPRPLTQNGSFDSCPAVTSDGLHFYFYSNRGAQKAGAESLQIFRLDLAPD